MTVLISGLTGRTVLMEHLYWHTSNVQGPEWAVDYLESAACDWTTEEIDFVDWVFNTAPVLKERAAWMALNEGLTYVWDAGRAAGTVCSKVDDVHRPDHRHHVQEDSAQGQEPVGR